MEKKKNQVLKKKPFKKLFYFNCKTTTTKQTNGKKKNNQNNKTNTTTNQPKQPTNQKTPPTYSHSNSFGMFPLTGIYVSSVQISLIKGKSTDISMLYEVPDTAQSISFTRHLLNN